MSRESSGDAAKRRRIALGLSVRQMSDESGVGRATIGKIEADDDSVEDYTRSRLLAALDRLEHRYGMDDPGQVTNVIELADGTRVTFTGSASNVADAAQRFLRSRGQ